MQLDITFFRIKRNNIINMKKRELMACKIEENRKKKHFNFKSWLKVQTRFYRTTFYRFLLIHPLFCGGSGGEKKKKKNANNYVGCATLSGGTCPESYKGGKRKQ